MNRYLRIEKCAEEECSRHDLEHDLHMASPLDARLLEDRAEVLIPENSTWCDEHCPVCLHADKIHARGPSTLAPVGLELPWNA